MSRGSENWRSNEYWRDWLNDIRDNTVSSSDNPSVLDDLSDYFQNRIHKGPAQVWLISSSTITEAGGLGAERMTGRMVGIRLRRRIHNETLCQISDVSSSS